MTIPVLRHLAWVCQVYIHFRSVTGLIESTKFLTWYRASTLLCPASSRDCQYWSSTIAVSCSLLIRSSRTLLLKSPKQSSVAGGGSFLCLFVTSNADLSAQSRHSYSCQRTSRRLKSRQFSNPGFNARLRKLTCLESTEFEQYTNYCKYPAVWISELIRSLQIAWPH